MGGSVRPILIGLTGAALLLGWPAATLLRAQERSVPASIEQLRLSFGPVVEAVAPAVVNVNAERHTDRAFRSPLLSDPFFQRFFERFGERPMPRRSQTSLGSGVIVDQAGLVVTNYHVINRAAEITVILADRREFEASLVRADADLDLAVLSLEPGGARLPAVDLGDSDAIDVGDLVLAIGNPFGIGQSVSSGIVSATARSGGGLGLELPLIQTDAAINPGNSGGALVGIDGRLVGINTAILTRGGGSVGVGFAIPANVVRAYVAGEIADEPSARPWLGAVLQDLDYDLARSLGLDRPRGTLVANVHPAAAAADAGLQPGDVLLAVDTMETETIGDVGLRLALAGAEAPVMLEVWRGGRVMNLQLDVRAAPREPAPEPTTLERDHPLAGLRLANLSPSLALELELDPFLQGLVVLQVIPGSPAARMRFRTGDVLIEADGVALPDLAALQAAVERGMEGRRFTVDRGGRRLQLVLG